ncbi:MAG TPA: ATP synthase subunit C [Steroidobacteraceae bacterium]|nr:ATP synthase subunit C [Steroidobacteraceae bacterium]
MMRVTRRSPLAGRLILAFCVLTAVVATLLAVVARSAWAASPASAPTALALDPRLASGAFLAAALSTALATLGAGYAVARVGSAAVGAIAEKPELFGRALVLVGLAEGIAIYGVIVSILILNRLG